MPHKARPGQTVLDSETIVCSMDYYRSTLRETNPGTFAYLSKNQRRLICHRLTVTLLRIRLEAEEHLARGRFTAMVGCVSELEYCLELLRQLKLPDKSLAAQVQGEASPPADRLKYVGLLIRLDLNKTVQEGRHFYEEEFQEEVKEFAASVRALQYAEDPKSRLKYSKTGTTEVDEIKQALSQFNDARRQWWVWGGMTAGAILDLTAHPSINQTLPYQDNLNSTMGNMAPTLGVISWILYLFRFFMDVAQTINETCIAKFTPQELHITSKARLNQKETRGTRLRRKATSGGYGLGWANDLLWGSANAICFFYLNGSFKTALGMGGYILSLVLLVGDVILTAVKYKCQRDEHYAYLEKLRKQESDLLLEYHLWKQGIGLNDETLRGEAKRVNFLKQDLIKVEKRIKIDHPNSQDGPSVRFFAEYQQNQQAIAKAEFDWLYQSRKLTAELTYTITLVASYACVCGFFVSSGLNLLIMGVAGTSLLFLVTIAFNIANTFIDRQKLLKSSENHQAQAAEFARRYNETPDEDADQKKLCELQMKASLARSDFDRAMARYQLYVCAPINTLIDVLTPVVFFLSFSFLSIAWAISVVSFLVVAILAAKHFMKSLEPKSADYKDRFFPKIEEKVISVRREDSPEESDDELRPLLFPKTS